MQKIVTRTKWAFLIAQSVKNPPTTQESACNEETQVRFLGLEDLLEKEMAPHSSVLAWGIPWTEEPGGLQTTAVPRAGHAA